MRLFAILTVCSCAFSSCAVWTGPARALDLPVDLELILAVDVSDSIDEREARLQREGYIAALTDPEVQFAIASGPHRRIAMTYIEWAQSSHQRIIVDWMVIEGQAEAEAFARALTSAPYERNQWTSISAMLDFGVRQFAANGFEGTRKVIDVSGDGANNHGRDLGAAREEAIAAGVTINGLPIATERLSKHGWPRSADVDWFYANHVIGGPGAFMIIVEAPDTFASSIRRKLLREIATPRDAPQLAELP